MKTLFDAADRYVQESDWKIIAVLKFCLISLGMMIYDEYRYDPKVKRIIPGDNPGITILVMRELY